MLNGKKLISAAMCTAIGLSSAIVPNVCAVDLSVTPDISVKNEAYYNDVDNLLYANYGDHVEIIGVMGDKRPIEEIAVPAEIDGVPVTV